MDGETQAASSVQGSIRGSEARRQVTVQRRDEEAEAAETINTVVQGGVARRKVKSELAKLEEAEQVELRRLQEAEVSTTYQPGFGVSVTRVTCRRRRY